MLDDLLAHVQLSAAFLSPSFSDSWIRPVLSSLMKGASFPCRILPSTQQELGGSKSLQWVLVLSMCSDSFQFLLASAIAHLSALPDALVCKFRLQYQKQVE